MSQSIFVPKKPLPHRDLIVLFIILGLVALFYSSRSLLPSSRVTVCGLSIADSRQSIESSMRRKDYRVFGSQSSIQTWVRMDSQGVDVTYDLDGTVRKIEGMPAEIDGIDVTHWTLAEIKSKLGAPSQEREGRLIGEDANTFLAYPQHRLMVRQDGDEIRFILFSSGR